VIGERKKLENAYSAGRLMCKLSKTGNSRNETSRWSRSNNVKVVSKIRRGKLVVYFEDRIQNADKLIKER